MTTLMHGGHSWLRQLARSQLKLLCTSSRWAYAHQKSFQNKGGVTRISLGQVDNFKGQAQSEMVMYHYERDTNPIDPNSNKPYHYHWPQSMPKEAIGTVLAGSLRLVTLSPYYSFHAESLPFNKFTVHNTPSGHATEFSQGCHLKVNQISTLLRRGFFAIQQGEIHQWYPSRHVPSISIVLEVSQTEKSSPQLTSAVFAPNSSGCQQLNCDTYLQETEIQRQHINTHLKVSPVDRDSYLMRLKQLQYLLE